MQRAGHLVGLRHPELKVMLPMTQRHQFMSLTAHI